MTSAVALPPFEPPYVLAGSCLVVVGLWNDDGALPKAQANEGAQAPLGFRPIRLFGRTAAVLILNHYTEPPKELPIRYRELISASLFRRGLEIAAVPFDMVLDAQVPVDLGRQHYGLPKRLDTSFVVDETATGLAATAHDLELRARPHGAIASACALPIRVGFALAVRAITASIDVLGVAYPPTRRARIALRPRGIGRSFAVTACTSNGVALRGLWCQSWRWTATWLGPPRTLDPRALAESATHHEGT